MSESTGPRAILNREFSLRDIDLTDWTIEATVERSAITRGVEQDNILLDVRGQNNARFVAQISKSHLFGENEDRLLNNDFCVFEGSAVLYCTESLGDELTNLQKLDEGGGYARNLQWSSGDRQFFATARDLFIRSHFNGPTWTVVSAEESDTVFASIRIFRWLFPGLVALAILSMLLVVMAQTRRQLTPLSVLRNGALKLGGGAFDTRITLDSNDEFSELAGTFNGMADNLGAQFKFLTAMSEIDRVLLSSSDMTEIAELVARRLPELLPGTAAAVVANDAKKARHLNMFLSENTPRSIPLRQELDLDEVFLAMGPVREHYTLSQGQHALQFLEDAFSENDELHLFPLRFEERTLGCLCVGGLEGKPISTELIAQSISVADRLTVALSATERQRRLYEQAHYDSLTGLPNRTLFLDRLQHYMLQASRKNTKVALIYIDLNHFKLVNDTLGHSQGDLVLRQSADRFRRTIRESDTLARLSGDEFVIALPELANAKSVVKVADTILKDLNEPFQVMDQKFTIGASIGIAIYPQDADSAEDLLKNADVAMYRAKAEQGNRYHFFEDNMNQELIERSSMGQRLRESVKNKQLHLVYQPKVSASTLKLHSAEALIRWHDPELGWVNPEKFIGIAEEIGLIEEIGEFVLNSACEQFAKWQTEGLPIYQIAVNVSPRQILYTDIVSSVAKVLDRTGLPGNCLELEITESLLINDYQHTRDTLIALQELGIGLALDDFGTGYSSLSYLHQLPFDTLKIDKSFVDNLGTSEDANSIIESIIALAKSLDKIIVAEGIEQEAQQQFLVERGCDLLQGYLYSKPLSVEDISSLLTDNGQTPLGHK
ncbi:MAG: EAL domain-containing protein [Halioglobus sp.]